MSNNQPFGPAAVEFQISPKSTININLSKPVSFKGDVTINQTQMALFEKELRKKVDEKIFSLMKDDKRVFELLRKQAITMTNLFSQTPEYIDLHGRLVGEFGFTPAELANVPKILDVLVNDPKVTKIHMYGVPYRFAELQFGDYNVLKNMDEFKINWTNTQGGSQIVSWVEMLEDGRVVHQFDFIPAAQMTPSERKDSRSGEGIMRQDSSGLWVFEPTHVFSQLSTWFDEKPLRDGLRVILTKNAKKVIGR